MISCRPVQWPFYFAFIFPIALILIIDWVMFIWIMCIVYRQIKKKPHLKDSPIKAFLQNAKASVVLVTLFGLGWMFGLLVTGYPEASMELTFTLQLLFCVFVSLQGILLFAIEVVVRSDARMFWLNLFKKCCPSIKTHKVAKTRPVKKASKIARRVTGLFRRARVPPIEPTSAVITSQQDITSTEQDMMPGITETSTKISILSKTPEPSQSPSNTNAIATNTSTVADGSVQDATSDTLPFLPLEVDTNITTTTTNIVNAGTSGSLPFSPIQVDTDVSPLSSSSNDYSLPYEYEV